MVTESVMTILRKHAIRVRDMGTGNPLQKSDRARTFRWYYDGQVNSDQPVVDTIAHEEDLIACGDRYTMNALVYCPD